MPHSARLLVLVCVLAGAFRSEAQATGPGATGNTAGLNKRDTSLNKTNTSKWKDEDARVTMERPGISPKSYPDTSLHVFQRNPFLKSWERDLGNLGSPINNLFFQPEMRVGPTLGYHIFDGYRFDADSLNYYTVSRPYSEFSYQLGSKLEQHAGLLHTQQIRPNWNFYVQYQKINSPGFFKLERENHDNAAFSTLYKSLDKHYILYGAITYNKEQHDENGGVVNDSELLNPIYLDRRTVDAAYQDDAYSITRSSVTNVMRDYTLLLQHSYIWGRNDTTYNTDSTQFTHRLIPRFSITHRFELGSSKHTYKDLTPDSLRYTTLFQQAFINNGSGYYTAGSDSVMTQQKWFWVDNQVLLNGYFGNAARPLDFTAGLGARYDEFISVPVQTIIRDSLPKIYYNSGLDRSQVTSTYLLGSVRKQAADINSWGFDLHTKFYVTGTYAGNFLLDASIGRQLNGNTGSITAGASQQVGSAPYSYTNYENLYTRLNYSFSDESISRLYLVLASPQLRASAGVNNYLVGNFVYINDSEKPAQYTIPFSLVQVWARKVFRIGDLYLDNELTYQQAPASAPVSLPLVMGRHQLSYERALFRRKMKIATGVEIRYNTAYHPAGYDALLNRFFYQDKTYVSNWPEEDIFFNFRIKRFRAFIMVDNIQQLFLTENTILFTGTPYLNYNNAGGATVPVYAAPNVLLRFGFNWVLIN